VAGRAAGVAGAGAHAMNTQPIRISAPQKADRESVAELLREYLPRIRNLVRYLVRGDQDVDDFAQEAMLAIVKGLDSYRGEGPLTAWIDRVTAHTTISELRRRNVSRRVAPMGPALELVPEPSAVGRPDEYLSTRWAVALLDHIPEEQREALVLHFVLEMSVPEVAAALGRPVETIRSRLRLGLERLRILVGQDVGGAP
jgi:RNA polymerase sigma-70 factor, ECF subfamily